MREEDDDDEEEEDMEDEAASLSRPPMDSMGTCCSGENDNCGE